MVPVCYGDYHVAVAIDTMLSDPNHALTGTASVQVCYEQCAQSGLRQLRRGRRLLLGRHLPQTVLRAGADFAALRLHPPHRRIRRQ